MRRMLHTLRQVWCVVTGRCHIDLNIDRLKRGDETFAHHLDWMKDQETASRQQRKNMVSARLRGPQEDRRDDHH